MFNFRFMALIAHYLKSSAPGNDPISLVANSYFDGLS
jgi:hypothetical protein